MTRDEIIQMAREAGATNPSNPELYDCVTMSISSLARFAHLVAAAELEACAKICEELRPSKSEYDQRFYDGCTLSAITIRNRHVQQEP